MTSSKNNTFDSSLQFKRLIGNDNEHFTKLITRIDSENDESLSTKRKLNYREKLKKFDHEIDQRDKNHQLGLSVEEEQEREKQEIWTKMNKPRPTNLALASSSSQLSSLSPSDDLSKNWKIIDKNLKLGENQENYCDCENSNKKEVSPSGLSLNLCENYSPENQFGKTQNVINFKNADNKSDEFKTETKNMSKDDGFAKSRERNKSIRIKVMLKRRSESGSSQDDVNVTSTVRHKPLRRTRSFDYVYIPDLEYMPEVRVHSIIDYLFVSLSLFIVNQPNPADPPKFALYHFYRMGQQGVVFFCHMNGV